jgi:hypothetical protein
MRYLALILILLTTMPAHAIEVWRDKGFTLEVPKKCWDESPNNWTGLRVGLTLPPNGYFGILKPGAIQVLINGRWVTDKGILITYNCSKGGEDVVDTRRGAGNITWSHGCDKQGGRVMLMIILPHMFPTSNSRPTEARWVKQKVMYNAQTYN